MYKRIIVKIGSAITLDNRNLCLAEGGVEGIVEQVAILRERGIEVVVVTSGAVATGRCLLPPAKRPDVIAEKQVFAAVGQVGLMSLYARLFEARGSRVAQVLVTKEDFRDRAHYANMRTCFENLLRERIVPVVNENDAIAVTDLFFTDNDELAGLIASQLNADAVIVLTSVDGVLADGAIVPEVSAQNADAVRKHVGAERSASGRGGMRRKFEIAERLMGEGIAVHIANGARPNALVDIVSGVAVGTTFVPAKRLSAAKRRLAHAEGFAAGVAWVNRRAEETLRSKQGVSILPVGVVKVEGDFKKGDVIEIRGERGDRVGFGIAEYGATQAAEAAGKKGARFLVHYDRLFVG